MKKKLLAAALAAMLLGSSLPVYAAPQNMADGAVFDADWYLQQNPDVAAAYPNATPDVLYQHYVAFGAKEGRTPYNAKAFNPATVLPYTGQTNTASAAPAPSILAPAKSKNKDTQNYGEYQASPAKSYLYENQLGGLTRVEYISDSQIVVEDYDGSLYLRSTRNIPMELPIWGGFYVGSKYNFVIFGQENRSENNNTEVVRVVKYSKDWQRLGQASLREANTVSPFAYGALRCTEYENYLYIHTCHQMYTTSDGLNHQANMSLAVRQSDMSITDASYLVSNDYGYVSHSFNQFILVDKERNIVTLDQGDAYPRALVLARYNSTKAGDGKVSGTFSESTLLKFAENAYQYQRTGACIGGFAETANGYVTAFNYDGQGGNGTFNDRAIYIGYTSKSGLNSKMTPITASGMRTPVLSPAGLDGGYIMWTDMNGVFYYTTYKDGGAIGTIGVADAALSDCRPVLHNGEAVWYVTNNSVPKFYRLNLATGAITKTGANGQ